MEIKKPLYHKVYIYLLDLIKGDYIPGDLLPTQTEIALATETSLITVKRAVKELEAEGFVETKAGKGTIVKKPQVIDNHVGVSSWTDSIAEQGNVPSTGWTIIKHIEPSANTSNILQLKSSEKTVQIKRLRLIEGNPICLMTNELPLKSVPGINNDTKLDESLYAYLKDVYNLIGASATEEVSARKATSYEIEILKLKTPIVLVIERTSYLLDNTPMEMSSIIASADLYVYRSKQINNTLDIKVLSDLLSHSN